MQAERYDFAVIGAGSVGLIAADFARKLGGRVILLERDRIGGDCTWAGCVPSKSLVRVAKAAHEMRAAARFGIAPQQPAVDMARVRDYLRSTIDRVYDGTTPDALQRKGIDVAFGAVAFADAHTVSVGGRRIRARKFLIGTGARPVQPPIPGLGDVPHFTYRDIFESDRLPERLAIIGGGPIGVELAQSYQRLGAQVTLVAERILGKEEPEARAIVARVLEREGVRIVRHRAQSVMRAGEAIAVRAGDEQYACDALLVAAGRRPVLDGLNLAAAGVRFSEHGIAVNAHLQTSAKHIYAAGDVLGGPQYSHLAGWQGFQAARNALLPGKSSGFGKALPRVTFCHPEVARVGQTESEARSERGAGVSVYVCPITREDRAVCDDDLDGTIKIVATRTGKILGATIVGSRAGEAIMEFVLAMQHDIPMSALAGTIHPYPTYASGIQLLTSDAAVKRVETGMFGMLIRALSRIAR